MTSILISGDSFASDWRMGNEWWNFLPYNVTNIAQHGASEYKILKQVENINILDYDAIIVFHTSPTRIYSGHENLLHLNSFTHKKSCYVINDVLNKNGPIKDAMEGYIKYFYNEEFVNYIHKKICKDIEDKTKIIPTIHASGFDYNNIYYFKNFLDVHDLFKNYRGNICHLNELGNHYLAEQICKKLKNLLQ